MIARRCLVSGKVQGVWFRDSTRRKALELGVSGSAVNLPDGRVAVIAFGAEAAVDALCDWLWQGSPMSQVTSVECEPAELLADTGFHIG